ncbi:MAG: cytochrome P450 [Chloroflexota bacterium]|nr:cytochrome P450 [Chloroflexota bacterium]
MGKTVDGEGDRGSDALVRLTEPGAAEALVERAPDGVWHVRGFQEAREILRGSVVQEGFNADLVRRMPSQMSPPVLFQDGPAHREQRVQTARYFTPAVTRERHVPGMAAYAESIVGELERTGRADLHAMAARMAISVAADVVGLTDGDRGAMAGRLRRILRADLSASRSPRRILAYARVQWNVLLFYLRDVRPAIRARREAPRDDVISHLLAKGRRGTEIMAECITYGAAGMVTTQEAICLAAWQCLRRPELGRIMREADDETRLRLVQELLRLEPVVGHLYRRAATDLDVATDGRTEAIPAGSLIDLDVTAIGADPRAAGERPLHLMPDRPIERGIPRSLLAFGSGPHHCAGEHIALAETDVFLRRLLAVRGLRIEREPTIGHNGNIHGYELAEFRIACDPVAGPAS